MLPIARDERDQLFHFVAEVKAVTGSALLAIDNLPEAELLPVNDGLRSTRGT